MNTFIPTNEQRVFIDSVLKLIDEKKGMMALNAPGGTGKTAVIKHIRSILKDKNIVVLAPTHKACTLFDNRATTIHKFFNAEKDINDDGEIQFYFQNVNTDGTDLVITDESSMVSEAMFESFKNLSLQVPILFCGDEKQIPPVDEDSSIVFQELKCHTFTKNMRSRDSLSNHWLKKFREAIDNEVIIRVEKVKKEVVYESFRNNEDSVVLAWTNRQVGFWNNNIRRNLYLHDNKEVLEKFYPNERLVFSGYRNTYLQKEILELPFFQNSNLKVNFNLTNGSDKHVTYYSSDIFSIRTIINKGIFIPFYRCQHQTDADKLKKCSKCHTKGHNSLGHLINFYVIEDNDGITWLKAFDKDQELVNNILLEFKNCCKQMKNKQLWKEYYGIKEIINPDINYIYSSTVHKAQGSQWKTVFVDIDNLRFCRDHSLSSRLQYTAVSRMIDEVLFV
jgi:molybdopterin-guanine dinucleotide biosynthesis protein